MRALIVFLADLYVPLAPGDGRKPNQLFDALTYTLKIYFAFFSLCLGSNVYSMTPEHHFEMTNEDPLWRSHYNCKTNKKKVNYCKF